MHTSLVLALAASSLVFAAAASAAAPEAARAQLAASGKLRAGMNLSNTLFMTKDASTGELRGVSVDLMRELASRLEVPVEFVVYPTPGDVADDVGKGKWDVAILAIEQSRAQTIDFSPPMTEIEATYVVHKDSPLKTAEQVDAPGIRIAANDKAGYELYLTRALRYATLVRARAPEPITIFNEKRAEAIAALKPMLLESMDKMPDGRMVEGRFMTVNHGFGIARDRQAGAEYLKAFVADVIASGLVARSIVRNRVNGMSALK